MSNPMAPNVRMGMVERTVQKERVTEWLWTIANSPTLDGIRLVH